MKAASTPISALPETGVPVLQEQALSGVFVDAADRHYGSMSSTVVLVNQRHEAIVAERRHRAALSPLQTQRFTLLTH